MDKIFLRQLELYWEHPEILAMAIPKTPDVLLRFVNSKCLSEDDSSAWIDIRLSKEEWEEMKRAVDVALEARAHNW